MEASLMVLVSLVCLACLTTISAAVLLQPLASMGRGGGKRSSDIACSFASFRMAPLRFSTYGELDRGSALELEPLTRADSKNSACFADPNTDSD
ncbi:uncharacterized protein LOC144100423 isoform X2 [Amblyomma americanum]